MAKINEFEIGMVCYNEDNKYTLEEINDMLIEWAESKDIFLGGSVKPCVSEENSHESAALPLHDVIKSVCPRCGGKLINTEQYGWFCPDIACRVKGQTVL